MELLIQVLLWCPRCWRNLGRFLFTACGLLMLLGLQLMRRVDRVEHRTGVVVNLAKLIEGIPLPIPSSPEGFAVAAFGAVLGVALAWAGKWASKF